MCRLIVIIHVRPAIAVVRLAIALACVGVVLLSGGCGDDARAASASRNPPRAATPAPPNPVAPSTAAAVPANSPAVDHSRLHPGFDPNAACTCDAARSVNGWCWRCNVGHVAGQRIESAGLFEMLDPHGHELDISAIQFDLCREVIASDGYCSAVGIGFVKGRAYFTRLTFGLASGSPVDADGIACPACQSHLNRIPAWCERCGRGIVGNVSITDRAMFDRTALEFAVLRAAIDRASTCELCANAMVLHRACPKCGISYEHDERSPRSHES